MRRLLILPLMLMPLLTYAGETVEVKVSGMYCPACAFGLQMSLNDIEGVKDAKVNYTEQNCRVEMQDGIAADMDVIKKAILDAGFSPAEADKLN